MRLDKGYIGPDTFVRLSVANWRRDGSPIAADPRVLAKFHCVVLFLGSSGIEPALREGLLSLLASPDIDACPELLVVLLAGGDANQMPRHSQYHVIDGRNWTDFMVDVVAQHVAAVRADGTGKGFLNLTPTVFLCHAKEDSALVGLLCSELRTHGLAPWFDKDKLLVGDRWREEIAHAIQTCHFFLICLTQQAATKRGFIQRELRFAISEYSQRPQNCPFLLPVRLQPCEVPQIVLDETSYLPHFQWFDLYDLHDGSVHRLAEMIHRQFQKLRDAGESRTSKWTVSPEGRDAAVSETVT